MEFEAIKHGRTAMPTHGLRLQAYQLLALALKAHDEGRPADAYDLTAQAMEHLEDAMSVEELRRTQRNNHSSGLRARK
jgi:hypothetical protein